MTANALVLVFALLGGFVLLRPRTLRSPLWRATVTPLASIIGSGFLVLAPLLVREFGTHAVFVMAALCGMAYLIGAAIRWNIGQIRARFQPHDRLVLKLERISSWALAFAYVISVCYYLNLFGAFALSLVLPDSPFAGKLLTSVTLAVIAIIGWLRGLTGLERAESLTVAIKLAVILGMLVGMAYYAWGLFDRGALQSASGHLSGNSLRMALGLIITVQGFETSRYLREAHDADTRIRTMRYAQWLSTAIYLAYIGFAGVSFDASTVPLKETAVIAMTAPVATLLPMLLVLAALAAQFSAAVADTNGCGGLVQEMSRGKVPSRLAYVGLAVLGVAMTWTVDIFAIISYASRAFACYYALQCALAARFSYLRNGWRLRTAGFALLTALMIAAAILGLPAE